MKTLHPLFGVVLALMLVQVSQAQLFGRRARSRPARAYQRVTNGGEAQRAAQQRTPQEMKLIQLIREHQMMHVGESWGQEDWQCFTWDDYRSFRAANVPGRIVDQLGKDKSFIQLVEEIRQLTPGQRNQLLARAAKTYKPTWSQLGRISRAGQTDAGQRAERAIAAAIVALVRQMLQAAEGSHPQ